MPKMPAVRGPLAKKGVRWLNTSVEVQLPQPLLSLTHFPQPTSLLFLWRGGGERDMNFVSTLPNCPAKRDIFICNK